MSKKPTKRKSPAPRQNRRRNLLPDEYKREGLVTVEMDDLQAALFAPRKLEQLTKDRPGVLAQQRGAVISEKYIVTVHRVSGEWEFTVEHDGETFRLPGAVFGRMASYRAAIIKEHRKLQALNRMRKVAEADQAEGETDLMETEEEEGVVPDWINDD